MPLLLDLIGQRPKANSQPRLLSFVLRLSRFTSHISLLTFFFALPAFSQQRWERFYDSDSTHSDAGRSVAQTMDGGYIIVGNSAFSYPPRYVFSYVYLIKTDAFGDTLWTRFFSSAGCDYGYSVAQTQDSGYIVTGLAAEPSSPSDADLLLLKVDASGGGIWIKVYGRMYPYDECGESVQQTLDGGYIITGFNDYDVWLVKTNSSGDTLWTRTYGGTGDDRGWSVQQTRMEATSSRVKPPPLGMATRSTSSKPIP